MEYVSAALASFPHSHVHTGIVQVVHALIWYDHRLVEDVVYSVAD